MASLGVHGASKERMLREIMRVDGCSYVEAVSQRAQPPSWVVVHW